MVISFKVKACNSTAKLCLLFLVLINYFFLLSFPCEAKAISYDKKEVTNIGAIIDLNSRIGKEEKTAMEIAVLNFNSHSKTQSLSLHVQDHQRNPLQAAEAAERLLKDKAVKAIIGMERWEEAGLVADIGNQAQVPVISFSAPVITPTRWPFLVKMVYTDSEQMRCIAELTRLYNWRRVVTIHEDNSYGGSSEELTLVSQALQGVGSQVQHSLVLPPFSSQFDPKEVVKEELTKLQQIQSRVFIVLQTSLPLVIHLFREAKEMGLVGKDSVWILTDTVTSFLDSVDTRVIYSMEGALGIKTSYSESISSEYKSFYSQFRRNFSSKYPEEDNVVDPGFYALRAYDSIATIIKAISEKKSMLLDNILSSNFTGLSGQIRFKSGKLQHSPNLRIVNVVGKKYKEIDFWLPEFGFSKKDGEDEDEDEDENENGNGDGSMGLKGHVNWPGDLKRIPKGWAMPSNEKPMIIGVPGRTAFQKFVEVVNASENIYDGYCIELFRKVTEVLGYNLSYRFVPYNGTYDNLVNHVYNKILASLFHKNLLKTYDAIVGDITVLAERSDKVEFTQPYIQSGLSMIAPVKSEESAWMFMKPFTWQMWLVTGAILIYTMFIVWFLEHQTNPEFRGPWKNQVGTAVLFTFSSLFFAHREKIYSNLTRLVVVVWLFVVLILNSSYTANLTSMLTIQRLKPTVTSIEWLKRNNLPVGCDGDSFVRNYLENVLQFKPENIKNVNSEYKYPGEFQKKTIHAAFLELPYQKVFINHYCKQFIATTPTFRFGGLSFVFQKGSPIAADVSKAILKLSEDGKLRELEDKWFSPSSECASNANANRNESLSLKSFWGVYLISGATSTICFLLFLIHLLKKYWHYQKSEQANATPSEKSTVWNKTVTLARYIYHGESAIPGRSPVFSPSPNVHQWLSSSWESTSSSIQESVSASTAVENIPENRQNSDHQLKPEV